MDPRVVLEVLQGWSPGIPRVVPRVLQGGPPGWSPRVNSGSLLMARAGHIEGAVQFDGLDDVKSHQITSNMLRFLISSCGSAKIDRR